MAKPAEPRSVLVLPRTVVAMLEAVAVVPIVVVLIVVAAVAVVDTVVVVDDQRIFKVAHDR